MAQPKMARFSESLETTAQILGKDFGIRVMTQGNRFRYDPAENIIYLPDIREEVDLGDESVEWERNAFLGGELHEIAHKLFSDAKFLNSLVDRLKKNHTNIPIVNRLVSLLTLYNAMEDIRIERKLCDKYDGASDLFKVLQQWCENDDEGIVQRHIKKLDGFIQKNEKLTTHDIRLLSWFVASEVYLRVRYNKGLRELAHKGYQTKYEAVRIINKLVDKIMENDELFDRLQELENIKAPLHVALAVNKAFHRELGKYFLREKEKQEEDNTGNVPIKVSIRMPKQGDDEEEESSEQENGQEGENGEGESDKEEQEKEQGEDESEDGREESEEEKENNKSKDGGSSSGKNKYETDDEKEDRYGDRLDDIIDDAMEERASGSESEEKHEPLSDDKYNDKIYSMYINTSEASAEQFDARNMLINAKIFIKYFGKNMKSKIPFPPVLQHDSNIEVSSTRMERMLENTYGGISPEAKEKFYANLRELDKVIFDLKWKVYTKLLSKKKTLPRIDKTEGEIDNEALATYRIDPRIYYELRWRKRFDTSVSMLCDLSGSMYAGMSAKNPRTNYDSKYKIDVMCEVMFVMSQIMQAFGIPFEVIGFNSGPDLSNPDNIPRGFELTDEMLMLLAKEGLYGDLKKYYRFGTVNNFILKSFRDNYETLRQHIYHFNRIGRLAGGACNCDNESFVFAVKRLMAMPNKRKIMLVISDGMPNPATAGRLSDFAINQKATELQEKMGKTNPRRAVAKSYSRYRRRRWSNAGIARWEKSIDSVVMEGKTFVLEDYIRSMKEASKYVEIGFISLGAEEIYNKIKDEKMPNLKIVPITHWDEIAPGILDLLESLLLKGEL